VDLASRHAFYDWCNKVLAEAEFAEAVEMLCQPYCKDGVGRPHLRRLARLIHVVTG